MSSKKVLGIDMPYNIRQNDIDKVFEGAKKNGEEKQRNSFPLRPSGALKSDLDLYFDLLNYYNPGTIPKDDMDGRVHILLESGHVLEDFIVEQYNRVHEVLSTNERVTYGTLKGPDGKDIELTGEYDLTFRDSETGKEMLGDSKTASDYAFRMANPKYENPSLPKEEHFAQLNLYMHSQEFKDRGIDTARIIYYNKNNSDYLVHEFKYNEELALKTLERFQNILDRVAKGDKPKQEYFWGHHWKAAYGSYRTYLHKQYSVKKDKRHIEKVSNSDFEKVLDGKNSEVVFNFAKNYKDKLIKTNDGKTAYLSLTSKGLVARVSGTGGFVDL